MEGLRAGVAEMRSVAQRLNQWADDLEASFRGQEASPAEVPVAETVPASGRKKAPAGKAPVAKATPEPAAAEKKNPALTLPEVRAVLAEKCASGFSTQVKALIESYGVSSLKNVPAEKYEELLEAVRGLGEQPATASGGNFAGCEVTRNERSVRGTVATIKGAEPEVADAG